MSNIEIVKESPEYAKIANFYGARCAERSGVALVNHINEGLVIMDEIGASVDAMRAFALHPILQADDALPIALAERSFSLNDCSVRVVILAMEYRKIANSYLCLPKTDSWSVEEAISEIGMILPDVQHMLIADKVQNRKDFMLYHHGKHDRSDMLFKYFNNWHEILGHPLPNPAS